MNLKKASFAVLSLAVFMASSLVAQAALFNPPPPSNSPKGGIIQPGAGKQTITQGYHLGAIPVIPAPNQGERVEVLSFDIRIGEEPLLGCSGLNFDALAKVNLNIGDFGKQMEDFFTTQAANIMLSTIYSQPALAALFDSLDAMAGGRVDFLQAQCNTNEIKSRAVQVARAKCLDEAGNPKDTTECLAARNIEAAKEQVKAVLESVSFNGSLHEILGEMFGQTFCEASDSGNPDLSSASTYEKCPMLGLIPNFQLTTTGAVTAGDPILSPEIMKRSLYEGSKPLEIISDNFHDICNGSNVSYAECLRDARAFDNQMAEFAATTPVDHTGEPAEVADFRKSIGCERSNPNYIVGAIDTLTQNSAASNSLKNWQVSKLDIESDAVFKKILNNKAVNAQVNLSTDSMAGIMAAAIGCAYNEQFPITAEHYVIMSRDLSVEERHALISANRWVISDNAYTSILEFVKGKLEVALINEGDPTDPKKAIGPEARRAIQASINWINSKIDRNQRIKQSREEIIRRMGVDMLRAKSQQDYGY